MPKLVLIDGSSYLYRAFHALPPLTNAAGEPTGALFGVVNMLRAHLKDQPEFAAFVLDAPGKTFRDDLDPEYKANRPPMPDELRAQVEPMVAIVQALGFPLIRVDGVEADDVIGTLAVQGAAAGIDVVVSTGDKDMAQLVNSRVSLVNTMSGGKLDSDAAVIEKFGVRADQIIDYLALMGDKVDNIPGVDKCGPKTAAKWLAEYASLDGVIANAEKIGGKIGDNLRAVMHRLPLNRTLTTIKTNVSLDQTPDQLQLRARDDDALRGLYARYGFNQALKELDGGGVLATAEKEPGVARGGGFVAPVAAITADLDPALSTPGDYECVTTSERLDAWVARL
ncbi:MAG: 5'-3' exonuclease H3TH domain-containing protein, partial [Thermomonas sp.]